MNMYFENALIQSYFDLLELDSFESDSFDSDSFDSDESPVVSAVVLDDRRLRISNT